MIEEPERYDEFTGPMPPSGTKEPSGKNWVRDIGLSVKELGRAERDIEVARVIKELAADALAVTTKFGSDYYEGYAAGLSDLAARLFPPEATAPRLCEHCGVNAPVDDPMGRCPACVKKLNERIENKAEYLPEPKVVTP